MVRLTQWRVNGAVIACFTVLTTAISAQNHAERSALRPPAGRVLHIAGQDKPHFHEYVNAVAENGKAMGLPAGAAFYTGLALHGLETRSPTTRTQRICHSCSVRLSHEIGGCVCRCFGAAAVVAFRSFGSPTQPRKGKVHLADESVIGVGA